MIFCEQCGEAMKPGNKYYVNQGGLDFCSEDCAVAQCKDNLSERDVPDES